MVTKRNVILLLSAVAVTGALLAGYWLFLRSQPELCAACHRGINDRSRAVVEVSGKAQPVCCVRCALTLERQEKRPVRVVQVADYTSGKPLAPDTAYYVEGSKVMLCEHHDQFVDESKRPLEMVFDRCMPSILAFARREDAKVFASINGGAVLELSEVLKKDKSNND